jgi:predicted DNA-binding transcriptional regulator AlpA
MRAPFAVITYVNTYRNLTTLVNYRLLVPAVEPEDLIDATEVAALLGLSHRNSVSVYRGRYDDFPEPVVVKSRCLLWLRADIEAWAGRAVDRP